MYPGSEARELGSVFTIDGDVQALATHAAKVHATTRSVRSPVGWFRTADNARCASMGSSPRNAHALPYSSTADPSITNSSMDTRCRT
jgi:hypothetical protein